MESYGINRASSTLLALQGLGSTSIGLSPGPGKTLYEIYYVSRGKLKKCLGRNLQADSYNNFHTEIPRYSSMN